MSWEDRVNSVKAGGSKLPKLADGEYVLAVDIIKEVINTGGKRGTYFIVEWVILQSSHPANPPGSTANMVIRMDVQFPDTPIGEVKGFAACLFGLDPTSSHPDMEARVNREITPDVIRGLKRPENPMRGSVLAATVFTTTGEKPFQGKYRFRPVIENGQPKRVALPPRSQQPPAYAPAPYGAGPGPAMPPGYGQPYPANPPGPSAPPPWNPSPGPSSPPMGPPGYGQPYPSPAPTPGPVPVPSGGAPAWTPPPVPAPAPAPTFPPAGWAGHPTAPGYYYKDQTVLTEPQLRAAMAAGQA